MSTIAQNLTDLNKDLPAHVQLVAVSKTKPSEALMEAYQAGQRDFGENKVQEMQEKWNRLPGDIRWHMIGHLQRNKVKYLAPFVHLIHAVDSFRLLKEINKQGAINNRVINCLLQIKIAREDSKFGLSADEAGILLEDGKLRQLKNVSIKGLMGMATFTDDQAQLREEFSFLSELYDSWKEKYGFSILSMGMSGDFELAIEHGSNMVLIGSAIFGDRQ
jgi:pyridoxal phosphate enzyme (YggS family)